MRDKNRIEPFMQKLTKLWKTECPDWRFGQLISNLQDYVSENTLYSDMFFIEDNEMIKIIERYFHRS